MYDLIKNTCKYMEYLYRQPKETGIEYLNRFRKGFKMKDNIKNMQEQIDKLQNELNELKEKHTRIFPKINDEYYYINNCGDVCNKPWHNDSFDDFNFWQNNCFKTEEEAEKALESKKIENILRKIAHELNDGIEIDWSNSSLLKHYLYYDFDSKTIKLNNTNYLKRNCLSKDFINKAINRIGEDRIIQYFKSL